MHVPEIPQHVLAKFEKFCLPREQAAFEKGRQAGRQEVMSGLDALRSFLPPSMHHNTPALAAVPVGPVLMSQPASPPDDDFDLDAIIKQIEGASPQDRQDLLLTAVAAVREAYLARGEDPTPVIESLKKMFATGGAEAALGSEPVWMAWQQAQTKKGGLKAVGIDEHEGRVLYGKQAEAALRAQENRNKRQEAGERRDDLVGKVQRGERLSDDEVHAMVDQHMASLSGQQLKEFRTGMMAKMGRVSAGKNKADRIAGLQQALKRFIQHAQENPVGGGESDQEPQEQSSAAAPQGAEQPDSGPETLEPDAEQPETLEPDQPDQNEPGPNVKQTDYEPGMEPPAEPMDAEEVPLDFQDGSRPKAPAAKPQEKAVDDHVEDLKRSRDALHRRANQMEALADDPEHEASEEERAGMRERAAQLRKSAQVMHDLHQKHTAKPEEKPKEEAAAQDSPAAPEPAKREASAPVETPPPAPAGGDKVMAQRRVRLAEDLAAGAVPSNHPWTKKELEETGLAGKAKSAKGWRELAVKLRAERDNPAPEKPESAPAAEKSQEPPPAAAPERQQEAPDPAETPPPAPAKPNSAPKPKVAPKPKTPPAATAPTPPPAPPPAPAPAPAAEPAEEPATELPATHPSSRAKAALKKIKDNPDAPESLFDEAVAGKHGPAARKKANEFSAQMGAKPYAAYAYAKHLRDNPDLIAPAEEKTAAAPPPKAAPTGSLVERAQGAKGLDAYDLFAEALAGKHGADAQKLAGDLHSEHLGKLNGVQIAEKFAQSVGATSPGPVGKKDPEAAGYKFGSPEKVGGGVQRIAARSPSGEEIGHVEYSNDGGRIEINDVKVHSDHRRRGVASALYDRVKAANPGATIASKLQTDDGAAFRKAYDGGESAKVEPAAEPAPAAGYAGELQLEDAAGQSKSRNADDYLYKTMGLGKALADAGADAGADPHLNRATSKLAGALHDYRSKTNRTIAKKLRAGEPLSAGEQEQFDAVNKLATTNTVPQAMQLHRVVGADVVADLKPGDTFRDPAPMFTGVREGDVKNIRADGGPQKKLTILADKGSNAVHVSGGEGPEVILPSNAPLEVVSVTPDEVVMRHRPAGTQPTSSAAEPTAAESEPVEKPVSEMTADERQAELARLIAEQTADDDDRPKKKKKKKAPAAKPEAAKPVAAPPAPAPKFAKPPAEKGGIQFDGAEYREPEGGRLFDQGEGTSRGAGHAAINDTLERAGKRFGINLGGRKSLADAVDDLGELDDKLGVGGKPFHSLAESYRKLADRVDQGDFDDDDSAADSVAEELTADVDGVDRDAMQMAGAGDDGRYAHALHNKLADQLRDDLLARVERRQQDGPHQTPRDEYVADAERRTRARLKGGFSPQYVASEVERAKKAAGEKWDGSNEKAYLAGKSQVKPRWAQTDVELVGHPNGMGPAAHLHKAEVEAALADGKPVPDHVQKHYKIGKYAASETPPAPAEPAVKTPPAEPVRARADAPKVKPSAAKTPPPEVTPEQAKLLKGFGLTAADVPALAGPDGVVNWDKIAAGKVNWGRVMKAREREKRSLTKPKEKPKATGPVVPTGRPLTAAEQERADELRQRAALDAEAGVGDDGDMLAEAMRKADEDPDGTGGVVKPSEWEQTVRPQVAARIATMQERLAQGKDLRTGRQGEPLTQQDLDELADTTGEADEQGNPLDAGEAAKRSAPKGKAGRPKKWDTNPDLPPDERMDKPMRQALEVAANNWRSSKGRGLVQVPKLVAERIKDDPALRTWWENKVKSRAAEKDAAEAAKPKKEKGPKKADAPAKSKSKLLSSNEMSKWQPAGEFDTREEAEAAGAQGVAQSGGKWYAMNPRDAAPVSPPSPSQPAAAEKPFRTQYEIDNEPSETTKLFNAAQERGRRASDITPTPDQMGAVQAAINRLQPGHTNADGDYQPVPIHALRAAVAEAHPDITPEQFDAAILAMRRDRGSPYRVNSIDDRSRASTDQLLNSVHAVGETFFNLEPKEPSDATKRRRAGGKRD